MSGPKLVGITCDEAIIRRNQERLRQIGKIAYYTSIFKDTNTDVDNTKKWILNYAADTLDKVAYDDNEIQKMLYQIKVIKEEYMQTLEQNKLNLSQIEDRSAEELNALACDLVTNIPKWKKQCIDSISEILAQLQPVYESIQRECQETEKRKTERSMLKRKREQEVERSQQMARERSMISGSEGFGKISLAVEIAKKEKAEEEKGEYTLAELALIENIKNELENYKKLDILGKEEKKLIEDICYYYPMLDLEDDNYSMNGKRNILEMIKFNYYVLTKKAAQRQAQIETEQEQRRSYELEYLTFCDALNKEKEEMANMTLPELMRQVERMRITVEKQEQRIYVEDTVADIMKKYGYSGISSVHLHEADEVSRIVFSDEEDKKICTSFGNGTVMMQVVGEGNHEPSEYEVQELVKQQGAFCKIYPEIKKELEERQIHILSENCAPVSAESAVNIEIQRQQDIKQHTKRHSVLKRKYGQGRNRTGNHMEDYASQQQRYMYLDE